MVIEQATTGDRASILLLLQQHELPDAGLDVGGSALVAREGAEVVGCVALEVYGSAGLLRSLAVDGGFRGRGIGKQLTSAVISAARGRGLTELYLLTQTAGDFFPRFGFVAVERAAVRSTIRQSVEWTSACPASALVMRVTLDQS
ncbi:MAG: hypothetical protein NVS4B8_10060 [Herpetosiphon sp.]